MGVGGPREIDASLRERLAEHGQEHVLRFWEQLDAAERERLHHQVAIHRDLQRRHHSQRSADLAQSLVPIAMDHLAHPLHGQAVDLGLKT